MGLSLIHLEGLSDAIDTRATIRRIEREVVKTRIDSGVIGLSNQSDPAQSHQVAVTYRGEQLAIDVHGNA